MQLGHARPSRPARRPSGTNLFADLNSALADTPPDRLAGVIMITDGQVHDVPKSAPTLGFDAPVHALLTGQPDEFDRRIEVLKAPRYGIVGSTRDIEARVVETGRRGRAGDRVTLKIRREGRPDETRTHADRPHRHDPDAVPARRARTSSRSSSRRRRAS